MTGKLARETVLASHPMACCRFGWVTEYGMRKEYYEIYPTRRTSGYWLGKSYRSARVLGTAGTKQMAWIRAATKVIESMQPNPNT